MWEMYLAENLPDSTVNQVFSLDIVKDRKGGFIVQPWRPRGEKDCFHFFLQKVIDSQKEENSCTVDKLLCIESQCLDDIT